MNQSGSRYIKKEREKNGKGIANDMMILNYTTTVDAFKTILEKEYSGENGVEE